jgi:hypothetical protein
MARRRAWGVNPTDAEADAAELRNTHAVAAPLNFDTPSVETVLQGETGQPDEPIPVRLTNPVNVNQLPTRLASLSSRAFADTNTVKVLNADPRRARLALSTGTVAVFAIGRTQAEAADPNAFLITSNQGPFAFHFTDELWARRIGGAATDRLSIAVEQWAR